jgi:hypothetical protein
MPQGFESTATPSSLYDAQGRTIGGPGLHVFGRSDQSPFNETRICTILPSAMHVNSSYSHRTETVHVANGNDNHPFDTSHLGQRQAVLGMRCSSNSSIGRYIYIADPPNGEDWQIDQLYLSFVSNGSFPMSPYHASVSVVSRIHDWSIVSEGGTPSMDTHFVQHVAPTGSSDVSRGTNKWLTLSPPYAAATRSGSYLVAYVILSSSASNAMFMGGSYMISRRST